MPDNIVQLNTELIHSELKDLVKKVLSIVLRKTIDRTNFEMVFVPVTVHYANSFLAGISGGLEPTWVLR